jgi:hypothetical protein
MTMYNQSISYFGIYNFVFKYGEFRDMYGKTFLNLGITTSTSGYFTCHSSIGIPQTKDRKNQLLNYTRLYDDVSFFSSWLHTGNIRQKLPAFRISLGNSASLG